MARIYPLFSSSKGNCIYFGDSENGILIDCGVSCKRVCEALKQNGISENSVKAVFITHTHSDHISGLKIFLKNHKVPLYAQQTNIDILFEKDKLPLGAECFAIGGEPVEICGFKVKAFETPHDTPASCGYKIFCPDGKTAALCTDLGEVTPTVWENICSSDLVMLESNYDPDMLKNGSYPFELKERIRSGHGHLSNSDCADGLSRLLKNGTMHFVLGHLSEENNDPDIARTQAKSALSPSEENVDYTLYIAPPSGGKVVVF